MGNQPSSSEGRHRSKKHGSSSRDNGASTLGSSLRSSMRQLEENELSAKIIDSVCGPIFDDEKLRTHESTSYGAYSEDISEETDSRMVSEDDTTLDEYDRRGRRGARGGADRRGHQLKSESDSLATASDGESVPEPKKKSRGGGGGRHHAATAEDSESFVSEDAAPVAALNRQPLASSFAKRCYFTKAGIGKTTQHYEGLTLTGNVVLMLSSAMKLKGCPTICDEDLRRVEQTYPNQFSRLPDELLLSSGWRRISKYCHFSNKPIPDGVPFFHSRQRCHPSGGYYFLLAAAVGMIRPIDVEPLTRDTLVLLETDFPTQCDAAPRELIEDPTQWTLVDKFCFFSGGPINVEEDVYYEADFDGNPIYMLAFLSPSLTPEELYKLGPDFSPENPGLQSVVAVQEVESVYDLTERDFDDLKLYHLGPCRALPPYILIPQAWMKVLPPHFLAAREEAMIRAHNFEQKYGTSPVGSSDAAIVPSDSQVSPEAMNQKGFTYGSPEVRLPPPEGAPSHEPVSSESGFRPVPEHFSPDGFKYEAQPVSSTQNQSVVSYPSNRQSEIQREIEEEGAFVGSGAAPMDEAIATRQTNQGPNQEPSISPPRRPVAATPNPPISPPGRLGSHRIIKMDPPDDEPPSLSTRLHDEAPDDEVYDEFSRGDYTESQNGVSHFTEQADEVESESVMNGGDHYFESPEGPDDEGKVFPGEDEYYDSPEQQGNSLEGAFPRDPFPRDAFPGSPMTDEEHFESPVRQTLDDPGFSPGTESVYSSPRTEDIIDNVKNEDAFSPSAQGGNNSRDDEENRKPSPDQSDVGRQSSVVSSDFSHQSAALRGAREILKKKQQKRLALAKSNQTRDEDGPEDELEPTVPKDPEEMRSPETWDTASDNNASSFVTSSSVWTESSAGGDRSSRRALILQMAKARMRGGNKAGSTVSGGGDDRSMATSVCEETSTVLSDAGTGVTPDVDFTGELD